MKLGANDVIRGAIGAAILACAIAAVLVPQAPLSADVAARWTAIYRKNATGGHVAGSTFTVDTVGAPGAPPASPGSPARVARGMPFALSGWAFDPRTRRSADRVIFRLDGGPWQDAAYHLARPDVAAALGMPNNLDTGFTATVMTAPIRPGAHTLELATVEGREVRRLPIRIAIVVTAR